MDFDAVIESQSNTVDMKSGLETLQGVSDAARCITETLVRRKVPEKKTSKSNIRTTLKQSFTGSYGHIFSIDIYDEVLKAKFDNIGKNVFAELMGFYLYDSVYVEKRDLSVRANQILSDLGPLSDDLTDRIRVTALKNIHSVSRNFDQDLTVRYRQSDTRKVVLAKFDRDTAESMTLIKSKKEVAISAVITRLNTKTGNGRLQIIGSNETVAFGFAEEYRSISLIGKRKFSENLDFNNGTPPDRQKLLEVTASPLRRKDGKIIKYIVEGYLD